MIFKNKFALMALVPTILSCSFVAYTSNGEDSDSGDEKHHLASVRQTMSQEEIEAASARRLAIIKNETLQLNIETLILEAKIKQLRDLKSPSQSSSSSSNIEPLSVTVLEDQEPLSSYSSSSIITEQQIEFSKAKKEYDHIVKQARELLDDPTLSESDQHNISNALHKAIETLTPSTSDQQNVSKALETLNQVVVDPVVDALALSNSDKQNALEIINVTAPKEVSRIVEQSKNLRKKFRF